ncbi:MAG: hypothetical protein F6J93_12150 [Oscillatoria sp. SIO1A7]|nr:hypothetical protein [Oscillatoria sp. SIO1A7]
MTAISILSVSAENNTYYEAVTKNKRSSGKTAGEALDAMLGQLGEEEAGTLVVVQNYRPDRFFSAEQQKRLSELMNRWRDLRKRDLALPPQEQAELNALVEAELNASTMRTAALFEELKG